MEFRTFATVPAVGSFSHQLAHRYDHHDLPDADLRMGPFSIGPQFAWAIAPAVVAALHTFRINAMQEGQQ